MTLLGIGGLAAAALVGGALADLCAACTAGFIALALASIAVLMYGGTRAYADMRADYANLRAEIGTIADARTARICERLTGLEDRLDQRIDDGLLDKLDQLESIVVRNDMNLAGLRDTVAAFIEELHRREQDELRQRRRDRRNG